MIGKLTRVPLREVWKHEAHDFTKWLCENLEVINEVTGLALVSAENEQSADDESKWPAIQAAMIDAMVRLDAALRPYIAKLPS